MISRSVGAVPRAFKRARFQTPRSLSTLSPSSASRFIDIHPEVAQAQAEGRAVVALESTLITHGLPPPYSLDLPIECEDILRSQGVTPATIAILDGRIKVGVSKADLARLSEKGFAARKDGGASLWKVGRRELGAVVTKKIDGGTTVSGTMAVAHMAGIKVFSTGGIGGVHRGAETSFDISSDLISLSDTPVAVVCAGSKSILDIGLTLEYLEAHAVPVAAYGTMDWPAFYTPKSGFKAPMQLDGARQVAETILTTDLLGLRSSLLLGVPIPEEFHAAGEALQQAVEQAVAESVENGMAKSGKLVTPWLLERVGQLTKGNAIVSNMALIKNNVKVGGEVALEYAKLLKEGLASKSSSSSPFLFTPSPSPLPKAPSPPPLSTSTPVASPKLVVVGGLAIDVTMVPKSSPHLTTAKGKVNLTLGGVAGNVSGAAAALGIEDVLLIAPVGDDLFGVVAREGLSKRGMSDDGLVLDREVSTATCGILVDQTGELVGGVADMDITTRLTGEQVVEKLSHSKTPPKVLCFDGNITFETMSSILLHTEKQHIPTFFEPTSNDKIVRVLHAFESPLLSSPSRESPLVTFTTPNIHELATMYDHIRDSSSPIYEPGAWFGSISVPGDSLATKLPAWAVEEGVAQMATYVLSSSLFGTLFCQVRFERVLVVQRVSGQENVEAWKKVKGAKGVVVASGLGDQDAVVLRHYPALKLQEGTEGNVTGAGDNLAGAMLAALVRGLDPCLPKDLDRLVDLAQRASILTLQSQEAVGDHTSIRHLLPSL